MFTVHYTPPAQPRSVSPGFSAPSLQSPSYTPETLTIPQVITRLESICTSYPDQIDFSLYQLNLFSAPILVAPFFDNETSAQMEYSAEQIPESKYEMMRSAIQQACDYILQNHFPFRDDACELFIIQAQAVARYGDWKDYPQILKFTTFAQKCDPGPIQQQRIYKLENIAYGYKIKASAESTIFNIFKTWFGFHAALATLNYFFPFAYSDDEVLHFERLRAGVVTDSQGNELYRDIGPYLHTRLVPAGIRHSYERYEEHAKTHGDDQIESRTVDPSFESIRQML